MPLRPTLTDLRMVGEFATTFRWNMSFTQPPAALSADFRGTNVLCSTATIPSKTINKMNVQIRGHLFFQPGIVSLASNSLTLNFVENVQGIIHRLFFNWQEIIWAHNIGTGVPYSSLVADDITLTRLDNQDRDICSYHLRHCFLKSYNPGSLSGNDSSPLDPQIEIAYDDFFVTSATNSLLNEASDPSTRFTTTI